MIAAATVLIACLLQFPVQAPAGTGSVEGTVKTSAGSPLARAHVSLAGAFDPAAFDSGSGPAPATTLEDGRFSFRGVPAGTYRLWVTRPGFARAEFPEPVVLAAGARIEGLQLTVRPAAAIAGRIRDGAGRPIGAAQVQALRAVWQDGARTLQVVDTVESNDRGEYRLFGLVPGSYLVRAIPVESRTGEADDFDENSQVLRAMMLASGFRPQRNVAVSIYFPGTTDWAAATFIDVRTTPLASGTDFIVAPERPGRVEGVVLDLPVGDAAAVTLALRVSVPGAGVYRSSTDPQTGRFVIEGVNPGSYILTVSATDSMANSRTGRMLLDVRSPVESVRLALSEGVRIPGRAGIEGRRVETDSDLENLRFTIQPDPMIPGAETDTYGPTRDGTFRIGGLPPGDHRLRVTALPLRGSYVKSMRFGNTDVSNGKIHLESGQTDAVLDIVIGTRAGSVDGILFTDTRERVGGATVVVVPVDPRQRGGNLDRPVISGPAGDFRVSGLAPGDYKAFAWMTMEDGIWQDPEFMRLYEERGTLFHVDEGGTARIQLTAIR